MAYSTIRYGSSGTHVKKLQEQLNKNGYNLSVDGQFGSKTQAAVNDYQKKNGLTVDGIVGTNTWGKLNGTTNKTIQTPVSQSTSKNSATKTTPTTAARPTYKQNSAVTAAQEALKRWETNKPSGFESKYSGQIDDLLNRIINGEEFSYDPTKDSIFQIYKDNAVKQGRLAMNDTIADAAALTGGYGSSYGVAAGQQAYQQYLSYLNSVIPELQEQAYQRHLAEKEGNIQNLSLLQGLDESDYGKYRDEVSDYNTELGYLYQKAADLSDDDYQKFMTELESFENDRSFNESVRQYQEQLSYQKERDKVTDEQWEKQFALSKAAASRSGGSGSSSSGGSSLKTPTQDMYNEVLEAYTEGGWEAVDKYCDSIPDYNWQLLQDHVTNYGVEGNAVTDNGYKNRVGNNDYANGAPGRDSFDSSVRNNYSKRKKSKS